MAAGSGFDARAWTDIARLDAEPQPPLSLLASAGSRAGVSTLVVDTGMLLNSNVLYSLPGTADQFVTVAEAIEEVRDPAARAQLATLPFKLLAVEPSQDALSRVVQFARATGDIHALSNVDLKLLALTYMLEVQAHGSSHLRTQPPPLQVLPKENLKLKDPPGWGSNVPNLEEWEEIGKLEEDALRTHGQGESHILDLQTISFDDTDHLAAADASGSVDDLNVRLSDASIQRDANNVGHLSTNDDVSNASSPNQRNTRGGQSEKKAPHHKQPVHLEGKSNVSVGVDATKGQTQEESGGWEKACSRSTRRKHQRRATRAAPGVPSPSEAGTADDKVGDSNHLSRSNTSKGPESAQELKDRTDEARNGHVQEEDDDLPELLDLEDEDEDSSWCRVSKSEHSEGHYDTCVSDTNSTGLQEDLGFEDERLDMKLEGASAGSENGRAVDSEENLSGGTSFRSSIGCMTADYAMQNVLLQIGLRLVSAGGMQVQELHRWVLKCQACNHVTADAGRMFCPKCGNGGTLYRMSVTVGANGILHAGRQRRVNLRGTRYSLPLPKGGREGALQNPILREDQLPQRLLNSKPKKVSFSEGLDIYAAEVFTNNSKAAARRGPNLGSAAAIYSSRKNPNERRVSRRH